MMANVFFFLNTKDGKSAFMKAYTRGHLLSNSRFMNLRIITVDKLKSDYLDTFKWK